jgi:hypothetical protein
MAVTGLKMGHFFMWSPKGSLQTIVNFDPMLWVHLQEKTFKLFQEIHCSLFALFKV